NMEEPQLPTAYQGLVTIGKDFCFNFMVNTLVEVAKSVSEQSGIALTSNMVCTLRTVIAGFVFNQYSENKEYNIHTFLHDLDKGITKAIVFTQVLNVLNETLEDPLSTNYTPCILAIGGFIGECILVEYGKIRQHQQQEMRDYDRANDFSTEVAPTQNRNR